MERKQSKWFGEYVPDEVANSTLFKFKIETTPGQFIMVDMSADLEIDYNIIQDQLAETPSIYAYWAAIYSELKMQSAKLERMTKAKRGRLIDHAIKEGLEAQVKLTEKQTQAIVEADKELNELEAKLLIVNKHLGKMYYMIKAIEMKAENIRSLAGFAKQEMRNGG